MGGDYWRQIALNKAEMRGSNIDMRTTSLISIVMAGMIALTTWAGDAGEKSEPTTQPIDTRVDADGWTLGISLLPKRIYDFSEPEPTVAAFDRDDRIYLEVELNSPEMVEPPQLNDADGMQLHIQSISTGETLTVVEFDQEKIQWHKPQRVKPNPYPASSPTEFEDSFGEGEKGRWRAYCGGDLLTACVEFPDGEYEVRLSWKNEKTPHFETSPVYYSLKNVTLEDAKAAAQKSGDRAGPVRLDFNDDGESGTLFNGSNRPIVFSALMQEETADAGTEVWSVESNTSIYLRTGWVTSHFGGCGVPSRGLVIVKPGQAAKLDRLVAYGGVDQGMEVCRSALGWRYADEDEWQEAYTDAIVDDTSDSLICPKP